MEDIAIIGGGAAGLAAAVRAAQEAHRSTMPVRIVIFEAADRIGKTILVSGNGCCNFSNAEICAYDYHNPDFVEKSFAALPPTKVLNFFQELGLMYHEESEGRLYPLTNKASSVLDVLRFAAYDAGVETRCNKKVQAITPQTFEHIAQILVSCEDDSAEFFDAVIVACGGKIARSILPSSYAYLDTEPKLAPLKTNTDAIKGLNNVRVRCKISGGGASELGEVLFRDYGISGIATFNISRFVAHGDTISIDFLPTYELRHLEVLLARRLERGGQRNGLEFCAGMFLPAVTRAILKAAGIAPDKPFEQKAIKELAHTIKVFPLKVQGVEDYRQTQVQRGGFALHAFVPETLQSLIDPGLFVVGEALDIDGPCGGYNLHWAWTSGILAGQAVVRSVAQKGESEKN